MLTNCRSRAVQIAMNLSTLDEWIEDMGLPTGIQNHFAPVRDLLNWLQVRFTYLHRAIPHSSCSASFVNHRIFRSCRKDSDNEKHESSPGWFYLNLPCHQHSFRQKMRRAVRDYKYEVNESRMTEECIQYLTQLQKDWERHRVKVGVEAIRKEVSDEPYTFAVRTESSLLDFRPRS